VSQVVPVGEVQCGQRKGRNKGEGRRAKGGLVILNEVMNLKK